MRFILVCDPRFDYGRRPTSWMSPRGPSSATPDLRLTLHAPARARRHRGARAVRSDRGSNTSAPLLEAAARRGPLPRSCARTYRAVQGDERYLAGLAGVAPPGPLARHGLPLRDHAQADDLRAHRRPSPRRRPGCPSRSAASATGTTATPGCATARSRSRRCWRSGFREEAAAFINWLADRIRDRAAASGPLQIMYRVDGRPSCRSRARHLAGYRGSRPVRIGNGAADQFQLDIYGEMVDAIFQADRAGLVLSHETWVRLAETIDWLCDHWSRDEAGIWETRGGAQPFIYGRLMSWVAFDRGVRLANARGRPADLIRWTAERDKCIARSWRRGTTRARRLRAALRLDGARRLAAEDAPSSASSRRTIRCGYRP